MAFLVKSPLNHLPAGFGAYLSANPTNDSCTKLPADLDYLGEGDVIRIDPKRGELSVLYRKTSQHNVLFFTERCNSRCTMCSQPPRDILDDYRIDDILAALPLMDPDTKQLCITGGEPTLLFERLIEVVRRAKELLPRTNLHMLSNGRLFAYLKLARQIADIGHQQLCVGIPLYSDIAAKHDFVVQSRGAFDQTVRGLMNLARVDQPVEIRIVIHKDTVERLPQTARFIVRNLPFVSHIAFMGLEPTGFARTNISRLWVDPLDYAESLGDAVNTISAARIPVSIYNHQLCTLPKDLWSFAAQSISDWKKIFLPACASCVAKDRCCGFFASATSTFSRGIRPL
jgi:His-Xaa-Ser system radical SAM maturase HxsC